MVISSHHQAEFVQKIIIKKRINAFHIFQGLIHWLSKDHIANMKFYINYRQLFY